MDQELPPSPEPETKPPVEADSSTLAALDKLLMRMSTRYRRQQALKDFLAGGGDAAPAGVEAVPILEAPVAGPEEKVELQKGAVMGPIPGATNSPSTSTLSPSPALTALMEPSLLAPPVAGGVGVAPLDPPGRGLKDPRTGGGDELLGAVNKNLDQTALKPTSKKTAADALGLFLGEKLAYSDMYYEDPPAKDNELGRALAYGLAGYGGYEVGGGLSDVGATWQAKRRLGPLLDELEDRKNYRMLDRMNDAEELKELAASVGEKFPKAKYIFSKTPSNIGDNMVRRVAKGIAAGRTLPLGLLGGAGMMLGVHQILKKPEDEYYG